MLPTRHLAVSLFTVFCCLICTRQTTRITELKKAINTANAPAEKLHVIFSLCEETESLNIDTLYKYALEARSIAEAQKNVADQHIAAYYVAYGLYQKSKLDSALQIVNELLPVCRNFQK
jgi:transcription elongation factor Elf1